MHFFWFASFLESSLKFIRGLLDRGVPKVGKGEKRGEGEEEEERDEKNEGHK